MSLQINGNSIQPKIGSNFELQYGQQTNSNSPTTLPDTCYNTSKVNSTGEFLAKVLEQYDTHNTSEKPSTAGHEWWA